MKLGTKLEYTVVGNHAVIRVQAGLSRLKGALRSKKGKGMSFAQIRAALEKAVADSR